MDRQFKTTPHFRENGISVNVQRVFCSECEAFSDVQPSGNGHTLPADATHKILTRRGWFLHADYKKDLCPDCQSRKLKAIREKNAARAAERGEAVVSLFPMPAKPASRFAARPLPAGLPVKIVPPATLTPAIKRQIVAMIEEHWIEPGGGYKDEVTDGEISRRLNIPRAWVVQIRDDMFGPLGDSEAMREVKAKAASAQARLDRLEASFLALMDEFGVARQDQVDIDENIRRLYQKV